MGAGECARAELGSGDFRPGLSHPRHEIYEAELAAARCDAFLRRLRSDGDPADDVHPWQATTRRRYRYKRWLPWSARAVPLPWARRHPYHGGVHLYAGDMWVNLSAAAVGKVLGSPLNGPLLAYLRRAPVPGTR